MIKKLYIKNFRQFKDLEIKLSDSLTIIIGDNTKGKSTILEAIYTLTNGNSPWAQIEDLFFNDVSKKDSFFSIKGENDTEEEYIYYRDINKRLLKRNGRNTISRKFFEKISSVLFSPEQIELLMVSSSKRREFIDNLVSKIDIEYSDILTKYNKCLRQRNAQLKLLAKKFFDNDILDINDTQLNHWTNQLSKYGAQIMSKKAEIISQLKDDSFEVIYKPSITLNLFEDLADTKTLEEIYIEALKNSTKRDIVTGHTNIGVHRDDWIIFSEKEVRRFGSRGEKRLAIGKLIFQCLELIAAKTGTRPILLLDDISSELDESNTKKILSEEIIFKQQTVMTAIDTKMIPEDIIKRAQVINLNSDYIED